MKKALLYVTEGVKAGLNALMCAFCFIKIDREVAHIPNADGEIGKFVYHYSIYDKLLREELPFLVYIAVAVMAASVMLSAAACVFKDSRKIRMASHVIFAVSAAFFLFLLFFALQIQYNY